MAVPLLLATMAYWMVYPWKSLRTWHVTSCSSRMSISWRLSNASSVDILVGDATPFTRMLKVAILIEVIRSTYGGEWARGRRWLLYFVLTRLRHYHSTPRPFPSYSSAFFQYYLFISGWGLSRIVRFRVFSRGGGFAPTADNASSMSSPSVLTTSVAVSCLVPSPCLFACGVRAVCLVGLSSNSVISASTVITSWGSVQVVKPTGFASSSWGVRSCLRWWVSSCCSPPISSGAFVDFRSSTVGKLPMPGHAMRSGGPQFDCQKCRSGCWRL